MTPSGILQLVRNVAVETGVQTVDRPVNAHLVRHSFITEQLRRGMNPVQLAQIVGHADTTLVQSDAYNALVKAFNTEDA